MILVKRLDLILVDMGQPFGVSDPDRCVPPIFEHDERIVAGKTVFGAVASNRATLHTEYAAFRGEPKSTDAILEEAVDDVGEQAVFQAKLEKTW